VYPVVAREIMPDEQAGKLLKIEDVERKAKRREVGMARTIDDLEKIAIQRGYSMRWVSRMADIKHIRRQQGKKEEKYEQTDRA
jgi:hypothetical protein